jgi:FdhD protein
MNTASVNVHRWRRGGPLAADADRVAVEEPLEIRVNGRSVAVVMRSPGDERELAAGFLFTEGVIRTNDDVLDVLVCRDLPEGRSGNVVDVLLAPSVTVDYNQLTRHVFSASSCGLCGKATLDAVLQNFPPVPRDRLYSAAALTAWPRRLREAQPGFGATGGVHASGLFDSADALVAVREDIGRHNALDKVVGHALLERRLPLTGHGLMLSGRVSFELVQKALAAGIGLIAGIGAPSTLAIDCAERGGLTVIGFLRDDRFNVYTHAERLVID